MKFKKIEKLVLFFIAITCLSSCQNSVNQEHVKKFNNIVKEYNNEELAFILGESGVEILESDITERPRMITEFINQNNHNIESKVKIINDKREEKRLIENYQNAKSNLDKAIKDRISKYDRYNIKFVEYPDFDGYYYFVARNGERISGGTSRLTTDVLVSEIQKTSKKVEPPTVNEIFRLRDEFISSWSMSTSKTFMYVIKGSYADISIYISDLKRSGFLK